jgi:hypothetical protein
MKKTLLTIAAFSMLQMNSQNCDSIKKENEYLKSALSIREVSSNYDFTTPSRIQIKIDKAIGDKSKKTITLKCHLVNKVSIQLFPNLYDVTAFDFEGNKMTDFQVTTKSGTMEKDKARYAELELVPDIPFRYDIVIKDIEKEMPIIKSIKLNSYITTFPSDKDKARYWEFVLENLKIEWK